MAVDLTGAFVAAIRSVVGDAATVPLHTPTIGKLESQFIEECLASTFVSSVGPFVTRFEAEMAEFTGARYAVAVTSGTAALHAALVVAGVMPGDEVIVPSLSFVATANAVAHAGATPVFIDSDETTTGMSPGALSEYLAGMTRDSGSVINPKTGRRVAAVVPMHTLGHPLQILEIVRIADEHSLPVVEDAAESLGSYIDGKHTGTFGAAGILSFNGNKILTTGGGGMILTDDEAFASRARHLTTTAKLPHAWEFEHDEVAWNYRMPNVNAAMGVAQLAQLDGFLHKKREIAKRYAEAFAHIDGLSFVEEPHGTRSNFWLSAVRLAEPSRTTRDALLKAAADAGLQVRPFWNLLSEQRMYSSNPAGPVGGARRLLDSVISLPSSPWMVSG